MALSTGLPASAASTYVWNNRYPNSVPYNCVNAICFGWMSNGTSVAMNCWYDADWYNGNYNSNRWFRVTSPRGYVKVHSSYVFNQTGVGHC